MKKIFIGTHNKGKFKEISYLLSKKILKLSPERLNIKSPKETGKTFTANSKLKADYFSKYTDLPVIADDSGLCIKVLKNKPGIYSARWAKKYGSFYKAMKHILNIMKKKTNRSATFICCLTLCWPNGKNLSSTGIIKGKISNIKKGNKGFGYDPIFIPDGYNKTFGEMEPELKLSIDHRYKAYMKIKDFFN